MISSTSLQSFEFVEYGKLLMPKAGASDFTELASTPACRGLSKTYNNILGISKDGSFFDNVGNYTIALVPHNDRLSVFAQIQRRHERENGTEHPTQRFFNQIRYTPLETGDVLSLFKAGLAPYSSLLFQQYNTETSLFRLKDYTSVEALSSPIYFEAKAAHLTNDNKFGTGTLLWKLNHRTNLLLSTLAEIFYNVVINNQRVYIINSHTLSLYERLLLCEAAQHLVSENSRMLSFALNPITSRNVDIQFIDIAEHYIGNKFDYKVIDLNEVGQKGQEGEFLRIYNAINTYFFDWMEASQRWRLITKQMLRGWSNQQIIIATLKGKLTCVELIELISRDISQLDYKFLALIFDSQSEWCSEEISDDELLDSAITSGNNELEHFSLLYTAETRSQNGDFIGFIEKYMLTWKDGDLSFLINAAKRFPTPTIEQMNSICDKYSELLRLLIQRLSTQDIVEFDNQVQLLDVLLNYWGANKVTELFKKELSSNPILCLFVLEYTAFKNYNSSVILELCEIYPNLIPNDLALKFRAIIVSDYRNFTVNEIDELIRISKSIYSQPVPFSEIHAILPINQSLFQSWKTHLHSSEVSLLLADILAFKELPILLSQPRKTDLSLQYASEFKYLIALYYEGHLTDLDKTSESYRYLSSAGKTEETIRSIIQACRRELIINNEDFHAWFFLEAISFFIETNSLVSVEDINYLVNLLSENNNPVSVIKKAEMAIDQFINNSRTISSIDLGIVLAKNGRVKELQKLAHINLGLFEENRVWRSLDQSYALILYLSIVDLYTQAEDNESRLQIERTLASYYRSNGLPDINILKRKLEAIRSPRTINKYLMLISHIFSTYRKNEIDSILIQADHHYLLRAYRQGAQNLQTIIDYIFNKYSNNPKEIGTHVSLLANLAVLGEREGNRNWQKILVEWSRDAPAKILRLAKEQICELNQFSEAPNVLESLENNNNNPPTG